MPPRDPAWPVAPRDKRETKDKSIRIDWPLTVMLEEAWMHGRLMARLMLTHLQQLFQRIPLKERCQRLHLCSLPKEYKPPLFMLTIAAENLITDVCESFLILRICHALSLSASKTGWSMPYDPSRKKFQQKNGSKDGRKAPRGSSAA